MENTTIVPNRDGIWGPLETTLKIHPLCVREQEIKQSLAKYDLTMGRVVKRPIDGLVEYHIQHINAV